MGYCLYEKPVVSRIEGFLFYYICGPYPNFQHHMLEVNFSRVQDYTTQSSLFLSFPPHQLSSERGSNVFTIQVSFRQ